MKDYVWTYWTKPANKTADYLSLASLCLSVELVKTHGNPLCVYTDDFGERMIKEIGLDVKTSTILNSIEDVPSEKWGISKMITYLNLNHPFCHIDTDVFLWKEQKQNITNSDFVTQAFEDYDIYKVVYNDYVCDTLTVPDEVRPFAAELIFAGYNMGYIDVFNIDFLHKYAKRCIEVFEPMKNFSNFNVLFPEQELFYCMSRLDNIKVDVLFEKPSSVKMDLWEYLNSSVELSYTHLMGTKRQFKTQIINAILNKIQKLSPKLASNFYYSSRHDRHLTFTEENFQNLKRLSIGPSLLI